MSHLEVQLLLMTTKMTVRDEMQPRLPSSSDAAAAVEAASLCARKDQRPQANPGSRPFNGLARCFVTTSLPSNPRGSREEGARDGDGNPW